MVSFIKPNISTHQIGGYWIYNRSQVDLSSLYASPEEKLWLVVKHYQGKGANKGYKLQKNDIVKFGRVRLRVRDIDDQQQKKIEMEL